MTITLTRETEELLREQADQGPYGVTAGLPVVFDPSYYELSTDEMRALTDGFLVFVRSEVCNGAIGVSEVEVRGTMDCEEDTTHVLVRLWIKGLSDSEIRRYHRSFSAAATAWLNTLSEPRRELFFCKLSFQMRSATDG